MLSPFRLSVCRLSSVTLVHPTQLVEIFGNFFSPYDSPGSLVFWCQKSLVGDAPFPVKFALKVTNLLSNSAISTNIGSSCHRSIAVDVPIYLKLAYKVTHPFIKRRFPKLSFKSAIDLGAFWSCFSPHDTLAIHWHPQKILRRSSQGNPSVGGF